MRALLIFALCFVLGGTAALIARASMHRPYQPPLPEPATLAPVPPLRPGAGPLAPLPPAPRAAPAAATAAPSAAGAAPEAGAHGHPAPSPAPAPALVPPAGGAPAPPAPAADPGPPGSGALPATAPANAVCGVCGMKVDPALGSVAVFAGKPIGVGCAACIPKVKADPARYAPAALEGRTAP